MSISMQGGEDKSLNLKLCVCGRPFDSITGQPLRKEGWLPDNWKPSKQKCYLCDQEFYSKKHAEEL